MKIGDYKHFLVGYDSHQSNGLHAKTMSYQKFLNDIADKYDLSVDEKEAFCVVVEDFKLYENQTQISQVLNIGLSTLETRMTSIYDKFSIGCTELKKLKGKGKSKFLRDWLQKQYEESIRVSQSHTIDWQKVCRGRLAKQKEDRQLRKRATAIGAEVNVYVPLDLLEHKEQTRSKQNKGDSDQRNQYQELKVLKTYEHNDFLKSLTDRQSKNKHIAIVGEAGAGKTTLLARIADELDINQKLQIFVSLADLQGRSLEEYIYGKWLSEALCVQTDSINAEQKNDLFQQFHSGEIWLLLDGLDEMRAKSSVDALEKINREIRDVIGQSRVVLTSRLNVWDAYLNRLSGFDTFKMGDFSPEQVDKFISDWFVAAKKPESAPILQAKLKEPNRDRIRDMVRHPLRLSLLCQAFYRDLNTELPETKAGLYELFVRYFYEWKPNIVDEDLTQDTLREELYLALGKLAIAGIDGDAGFRLSRSLAVKEMGDRLFRLASDVGWLTLIERDEQDQEVYAFYHASFQEYFAALAIDDWDFFLPRDHGNKPVKGKRYRVFESSWQEVILIWSGISKDLNKSDEIYLFIDKLLTFQDGCSISNDYRDLGYFIGLDITIESDNLKSFDTILDQIIEWAFGYYTNDDEAKYKLRCVPKKILISKISKLLPSINSENILLDIVNFLLSINTDNSVTLAIEYLLKLALKSSSKEKLTGTIWHIQHRREIIAKDTYLIRLFVEFIYSLDLNFRYIVFGNIEEDTLSRLVYSTDSNESIYLLEKLFVDNPNKLVNILTIFNWSEFRFVSSEHRLELVENDLNSINLQILRENIQNNWDQIKTSNEFETPFPMEEDEDETEEIIYCTAREYIAGHIDYLPIHVNFLKDTQYHYSDCHSESFNIILQVLKMEKIVDTHDPFAFAEIDYQGMSYEDIYKVAVENLSRRIQFWYDIGKLHDDEFDYCFCYRLLFNCAQNLSYPNFYSSWHILPNLESQFIDCSVIQTELDHAAEHPEIRCLVVDISHLENLTDQNLLSKRIWNGLQKQLPDFELPKVNDIGDLEYELDKLQRKLGGKLVIAAIYGNKTNEEIEQLCQNLTQIKTYQWTEEKDTQKLIANINAWLSELNVRQDK